MATTQDPRSIMNSIFAKTSGDQKKLINNWCKSTYGLPLQMWTRQVDLNSTDLKVFLVEMDKALESDNWTFFDPESNNPSDGQAVETTPLPHDAEEDAEEDEEEAPVPAPVPAQDGRGVPVNRVYPDADEEEEPSVGINAVTQPSPAPAPTPDAPCRVPVVPASPTDPFALMMDAIVSKVIAQIGAQPKNNKVDPAEINKAVDKRLANGGFPTERVVELIDERMARNLAAILRSQDAAVARRAIELYNKGE